MFSAEADTLFTLLYYLRMYNCFTSEGILSSHLYGLVPLLQHQRPALPHPGPGHVERLRVQTNLSRELEKLKYC